MFIHAGAVYRRRVRNPKVARTKGTRRVTTAANPTLRGPRTLELVDKYRQDLGVSDEGWEQVQAKFQRAWRGNVEELFPYLVEYTLDKAQEEGIRHSPVVELVQLWVDDGAPRGHTTSSKEDIRELARQALNAYLGNVPVEMGDIVKAWRGTNRKEEYDDVKAGVQIRSRNHVTHELEPGLSVSMSLGTVWAYGYEWAYEVKGRVNGFGSDGEPTLEDTDVAGPLLPSEVAVEQDWETGQAAKLNKLLKELSVLTGATKEQLIWLRYSVARLR